MTDNGLTGSQALAREVDYGYTQPIYDGRDRISVGFHSVTENYPELDGGSATNRTTTFATAPCADPPATSAQSCTGFVDYSYNRLLRGVPIKVEEGDTTTNVLLRTTINQYTARQMLPGLDGRAAWFRAPLRTGTYLWNPGSSGTPQPELGSLSVTRLPDGLASQGDPLPPLSVAPSPPPSAVAGATLITRSFDYDRVGNVVKVVGSGPGAQPLGRQLTWNRAAGDTSGWNYRLMDRQIAHVCDLASATLCEPERSVQYTYDSVGRLTSASSILTGTRPLLGPDHDASSFVAGQPLEASVEGSRVFSVRAVHYDFLGNVQALEGPSFRCTSFIYDPLYGQLPVQSFVHPSGCEGPAAMETDTSFDRGLETVTRRSTPFLANGPIPRITVIKYDGFGRMVEVDAPSAELPGATALAPALKIQYQDQAPIRTVSLQTVDGPEGAEFYIDHFQFIDGLGDTLARVDRIGSPSVPSVQYAVSGVHTRLKSGLVKTALKPFPFTGSPPDFAVSTTYDALTGPQSSFTYDGLGRPLSLRDFKSNLTQISYQLGQPGAAMSTELVDAEQASGQSHDHSFTTRRIDYLGRVIETVAHLNRSSAGPPTDIVTSATYLATGEPVTVTRGAYTRWMQYDSLGRLVRNAEPNTSLNFSPTVGSPDVVGWTYAYNDNGEVVGTSDARGCGEVIYRDGFGRPLAEDYSPCETDQPAYTPPRLGASRSGPAGDGTEAYYLYDDYGELAQSFDRSEHSVFQYDGRGRITKIARQLARPGFEASLRARYAPHLFTLAFPTYSEADRVLEATTGADVSALMGPDGASSVFSRYLAEGAVDHVESSYGSLLDRQILDETGAVTKQVFEDAARTTARLFYDDNGALSVYRLTRGPGPWASYTELPPIASDPNNTLQGVLTDLTAVVDKIGNPVSIMDSSDPAQWPSGAKPASFQLSYSDDYRLRHMSASYGSGADAFVSPYEAEAARGDTTFPQPATADVKTRVQTQDFVYDDLGNLASTSDDLLAFYDRSLGTITNGTTGPGGAVAGPNQIVAADTPDPHNQVRARYDAAGNTVEVRISRIEPGNDASEARVLPPRTFRYRWDELGRLATASRTEGTRRVVARQEFAYDFSGQRVRKSRGALVVQNGTAKLVEKHTLNVFDSLVLKDALFEGGDYQNDATTERLYLNAGGSTLGHVFYAQEDLPSVSSGHLHMFMPMGDPLGSTSFVIDHETGELIERTSYQPYGEVASDYRPDRWGNFREDVRFTGHWDDAEVGLVYFGARYYAPHLGRFISPDPLAIHALRGDLNPYAYVHGSPMRYVDPLGLQDEPFPSLPPGTTDATFISWTFELPPGAEVIEQSTANGIAGAGSLPTPGAGGSQNLLGQALGGPGSGLPPPLPYNAFNPGNQPKQLYLGRVASILIPTAYRAVTNHIVYSDRSIREIAHDQGIASYNLQRPDLYDLNTTGLYEIKSAREGNQWLAALEARFYIALLIHAGVPATPGSTNQPGAAGIIPAPGGYFAYYSPKPAAIVYEYLEQYGSGLRVSSTIPVNPSATLNALLQAGALGVVAGILVGGPFAAGGVAGAVLP